MRRVLLLVALAALLGHVCALESGAAHGAIAEALSTRAPHTDPGGEDPALHLASCDGVKPTSMAPLVSAVESGPMATVRPARIWSRPLVGAWPLPVPRAALFLLHASLLM